MDRLMVSGGRRLSGSVMVGGAKNSALKLMAAALLAEGTTVIENVPRIVDCLTMGEVLEHLGAGVQWEGSTLTIDTSNAAGVETPYELVRKMRASIIVLGPLLARHGRARVAMPGGCNIGSRKIDLHVRGFERMGVQFSSEHGYLEATAPSLRGAFVTLDFPSVGATENLLMAAVGATGRTVIENAAREPEIQDLAGMLVEMGAKIDGAGSTAIEIEGVDGFEPVRHRTIPDRVEAGTFALAACITQGDVMLEDARADHLDLVLDKLNDAGAQIEAGERSIRVSMPERALAVDLVTLPYPGFPTDLQPQIMSLLSVARGTSILTENVFESRFMFVDELNRMGADIRTEGHHAVIRGMDRLSAAPVRALDIRAGAAMIIAALAADGTTEVFDLYHVDRGYEDFDARLAALGADVHREREPSPAGLA
ncbi:MAG: UDP-N-acetylglucosamine 1-carboxyvinyltransferase [Actinobacteria bacterium]|nr:MAG: UDP-N-acetylglucosamine 1-carboxyvinyltransferase [Actinomycetota bacterium]